MMCLYIFFFSLKRSLRSTEIFAATLTLFGSVVSISFGGVLASKKKKPNMRNAMLLSD